MSQELNKSGKTGNDEAQHKENYLSFKLSKCVSSALSSSIWMICFIFNSISIYLKATHMARKFSRSINSGEILKQRNENAMESELHVQLGKISIMNFRYMLIKILQPFEVEKICGTSKNFEMLPNHTYVSVWVMFLMFQQHEIRFHFPWNLWIWCYPEIEKHASTKETENKIKLKVLYIKMISMVIQEGN